jgi:ABC-type antimicrobial peptide transport system permease subunit
VEKSLLLSPVGSPQAFGLDEEQIAYQHYLPTSEEPRGYMAFAVRTSDQSARLAPTMRQAVAAVDPLQPVNSIEWLSNEYAETIAKPRFNSFLMSVLAVVATVLTLIGVYGVLSFAVSTRTRELGIRLALGAPRARVRRLVILSGLRMTVLGAVLGVGLAIALSRFLQTLLFGTSTRDVGTYVFVGALVIGAGMIAAYVPSRRAMSVDPAHVLRSE